MRPAGGAPAARTSGQHPDEHPTPMNKAFRATCDRTIQRLFECSPLEASWLGSTVGMDRLPDVSAAGWEAAKAQLEDALAELRKFEKTTLNPNELHDLRCLENHIRAELRTEEELRLRERSPSTYVQALALGLWGLAERKDLSPKDRGQALVARLGQLEAYLTAASKNLGQGYDVPAAWTDIACRMLDGLDAWFLESLAPFAATCGALAEEVGDAVEGSRRLLLRFRTFLGQKLLPSCDGSFAIGRIHFEYLLDKRQGASTKAVELVESAQERVQAARHRVERAAEALGTRSLKKALADMQGRAPALGKVEGAYEKQIERALEATRKHDLATVPAGAALEVAPMPPFLWPIASTVWLAPPAYDGSGAPRLLVRPVDKRTAEDEREGLLAEHSAPQVQARAASLGFPGAALMGIVARAASRVRAVSKAHAVQGGWALLAAEAMDEAGFLKDPKTKLAAARARLEAAVELELDAKLHMQLMSFDSAVDYLARTCLLPVSAATATVRRLTLTPTDASAAVLGFEELVRSRKAAQDEHGDDLEPRALNDKVLATGGLSLAQARHLIR